MSSFYALKCHTIPVICHPMKGHVIPMSCHFILCRVIVRCRIMPCPVMSCHGYSYLLLPSLSIHPACQKASLLNCSNFCHNRVDKQADWRSRCFDKCEVKTKARHQGKMLCRFPTDREKAVWGFIVEVFGTVAKEFSSEFSRSSNSEFRCCSQHHMLIWLNRRNRRKQFEVANRPQDLRKNILRMGWMLWRTVAVPRKKRGGLLSRWNKV